MKKDVQVKVEEVTPLLNKDGTLCRAGYSTHDVWQYNKENVAYKGKIKEWEFYQINNPKYLFQAVYGNVTYAGSASFTLLDFTSGQRYSAGVTKLFAGKSFALNFTTGQDHEVNYSSEEFSLHFEKRGQVRKISVSVSARKISAQVDLTVTDKGDAMCYVMPFKNKLFYYNYKKFFDCLQGSITVNSNTYGLENSHCLIDSGRGCWPYRHTWLWGMAKGKVGERSFAFDIGYGDSDRGDTAENMLFVSGKAHKLAHITVESYKVNTNQLRLKTTDNRLDMIFTPVYDNHTDTNLVFMHNSCHQVFGYYSGKAVLDSGEEISFSDIFGFCEKARNRW